MTGCSRSWDIEGSLENKRGRWGGHINTLGGTREAQSLELTATYLCILIVPINILVSVETRKILEPYWIPGPNVKKIRFEGSSSSLVQCRSFQANQELLDDDILPRRAVISSRVCARSYLPCRHSYRYIVDRWNCPSSRKKGYKQAIRTRHIGGKVIHPERVSNFSA